MMWLILALFTAFFQSLRDVFSKKSLGSLDEYSVLWLVSFCIILILSPSLIFSKTHFLGRNFWFALAISGSLNIIGDLYYLKALKVADLSMTVPLLAFSPLFLLISSPLIMGEFPKLLGIIGVLLVVFGSYILNINLIQGGILEPLKALVGKSGSRYMLLVAFLWSISANFDKIGTLNSSALIWSLSINLLIFLFLTPIVFLKNKFNFKLYRHHWKKIFRIGLFAALTIFFNFSAYTYGLVAYVISIKRISVLFGVLFGYFIFKEKGLRSRLIGAFIMLAGVFLISFS